MKEIKVQIELVDGSKGYGGSTLATTNLRAPAIVDPAKIGKMVAESITSLVKRDADLWEGVEIETK